MALVTKNFGGRYQRFTNQSGANAILALSTPTDVALRILCVTTRYSAGPTQSGVTVDLDSGAGAAWDTLLASGSANARDTVYFPDGKLTIADGDALKVTAPAGGGVITSSISIYVEVL